jgi:hypothetical protein
MGEPDNRVQAFFAKCPNAQHVAVVKPPNVLLIRWSRTGTGFGEITLVATETGLKVDSEHMGTAFVKEVLGALIDDAKASGRWS